MKKIKIILLLFILMELLSSCSNSQTTVKEKIDQANYVRVEFPQSGVIQYVDLAAKRRYGNETGAISDTIYAYQIVFHNKFMGFNYFKRKDMLYPIITDNIRITEVRKSKYIIVKDVKNKANQKNLIDIWHGDGFKGYKVRIFYNHDYLPIKVQLISKETSKWTTIIKYSYLHINHTEYKDNWNKYVKRVRSGEFED